MCRLWRFMVQPMRSNAASACTAAVACFRVRPYAVTPGRSEMSASQRPSSSRKYSMAKEKPVEDFGMNPSCHQFADGGETRQQGRSHGRQNDGGDHAYGG